MGHIGPHVARDEIPSQLSSSQTAVASQHLAVISTQVNSNRPRCGSDSVEVAAEILGTKKIRNSQERKFKKGQNKTSNVINMFDIYCFNPCLPPKSLQNTTKFPADHPQTPKKMLPNIPKNTPKQLPNTSQTTKCYPLGSNCCVTKKHDLNTEYLFKIGWVFIYRPGKLQLFNQLNKQANVSKFKPRVIGPYAGGWAGGSPGRITAVIRKQKAIHLHPTR